MHINCNRHVYTNTRAVEKRGAHVVVKMTMFAKLGVCAIVEKNENRRKDTLAR